MPGGGHAGTVDNCDMGTMRSRAIHLTNFSDVDMREMGAHILWAWHDTVHSFVPALPPHRSCMNSSSGHDPVRIMVRQMSVVQDGDCIIKQKCPHRPPFTHYPHFSIILRCKYGLNQPENERAFRGGSVGIQYF